MSRQSEKYFAEVKKYLDAHQDEITNEEDVDRLVKQYNDQVNQDLHDGKNSELTVFDYLDMAEEVKSKKKRMEYIQKALELEPDNLDAAVMQIEVTTKQPQELLSALEALIEKANNSMAKNGYFRDGIGDFWGILETRPYMRLLETYFDLLVTCGMLRAAIEVGKRMLELCENDNLGIRFSLIHLYAQLEEESAAKKLFRKYQSDDKYAETSMLLPMIMLYYKLRKNDIASSYLQQLMSSNSDTKYFFTAIVKGDIARIRDEMDPSAYCPDTLEELVSIFFDHIIFYANVPDFYTWASEEIKQINRRKREHK